MSANEYVKAACANVITMLEKDGLKLATRRQAEILYHERYRLEVDLTYEVNGQLSNRYQNLIGILQYPVELGRFYIHFEVAKLFSFKCNPKKGHMEAVYNIFSYRRKHVNPKIVFDHQRPQYDETRFIEADWKSLYGDASKDIPAPKPESRGITVQVYLFCDADHTGNLLIC